MTLVKQLKKILKIYNYSFACSDGVDELKAKQTNLATKLTGLRKDLENIDFDSKTDKIKQFLIKSK